MIAAPLEKLASALSDPNLGETVLPDGSGVLLDVDGHQVLTLSKTAVFLVQLIRDGGHTNDSLAEHLHDNFRVDIRTARKDVDEFLESLAKTLLDPERETSLPT